LASRASQPTLTAVIIAAGEAARLRPHSNERPKALMELAPGLTIIDYTIKQLRSVGVNDVVVVTRSEHRSMFESRLGGRARVVVLESAGMGNLTSVGVGLEAAVSARILLVMSDHIFETEILRRLVKADDGTKRILLCVDSRPDHRDLREGLKVHTSQSDVRRVGKEIPPHTGVDVGLFILSHDVRDLVDNLNHDEAGQATIADLVNRLATEGAVGHVDVTGRMWQDVDTEEDLLVARQKLWEMTRRNLYKPTDGPVSRWFNRPISTRISLFLFRHTDWATPNLFTIVSFISALTAGLLFLNEQLILGGILVHLSSILDGVDGELARLREKTTMFGRTLDSVLDRLGDVSIILGLGLLLSPGAFQLTLTVIAVFGVVLVSHVTELASEQSNIAELRSSFPWATRDVRLFVTSIGALAFQPLIPILFCAVTPPVFAIRTMAALKQQAQLQSPQTGPPIVKRSAPFPDIARSQQNVKSHEIRKHVEGLITNLIKVSITLMILQTARGFLGEVSLGVFSPAPIQPAMFFDIAQLLIVVYFGYRILFSLKFFADIAANYVVARLQITRSMYTRATTDFLYILMVALAWFIITPIVARLPEIGSLLLLPTNIVFLGLTLILTYDLLRIMNRGFKWAWDALMGRLTESLDKLLHHEDDTRLLESATDQLLGVQVRPQVSEGADS